VAHQHPHEKASGENRLALAITLALTASFTAAEVVGGLLTGSLALLGYLDDLINIPLGVALAIKLIPDPILAGCREKARETSRETRAANRGWQPPPWWRCGWL